MEILRQDGWSGLLKKTAIITGRWAFYTTCSTWICRSLRRQMNTAAPDVEIVTRFLVEDKKELVDWIRDHHAMFPWIYSDEEVELAKKEDHIFVGLFHGREIVGYIKVGVHQTYVQDFREVISFPAEDAFIYDTFVLPEYRGKHVALHGLMKTLEFLRESGFERAWAHIEEWNRASRDVYRNAAFEDKWRIRQCRLFGWPFFIKDGYRPLIGLERLIRESSCETRR